MIDKIIELGISRVACRSCLTEQTALFDYMGNKFRCVKCRKQRYSITEVYKFHNQTRTIENGKVGS